MVPPGTTYPTFIFFCIVVATATGFLATINNTPLQHNRQKRFVLKSTTEKDETSADEDTDSKRRKNNGDIPAWLKLLIRREQTTSVPEIETLASNEKLFDSFPFSIGGKDKRSKIWESEMTPLVASLSGMINVEALLAAANVTAENIAADMESVTDLQDLDMKTIADLDIVNESSLARIDSNVLTDALSFLDGSMRWDKFMQQAQKRNETSIDLDVMDNDSAILMENSNSEADKSSEVDKILGQATKQLEFAVNSVSSTFSPSAIQDLVVRASKTLALREASGNLTVAAKMVFDEASKAPRATAKYTAELIVFANTTLAGGMKPLFKNYESVKSVSNAEWNQVIRKGAEYGAISSAIYDNTVPNTLSLGHSIVAQGKSSDIAWMMTDSIQQSQDFNGYNANEPVLVRSLIFRGFDASDEEVDREALLNTICSANPVPLGNSTLVVHGGMLRIAENLYEEIERYIDLTAPTHKFVFAGHSIGGSLSILLMAILSQRKSASFVRERLLRVFTYGSPPTLSTIDHQSQSSDGLCSILAALELPQDLVHGYSQPWDPVPRLFTEYDPLYPLVDDLGEDGVTPYVSGPSRTLRPIVKAILEAWEGWPELRSNVRNKMGQNYKSVGKQFLLLPDPTRYLTDRLVSVNIPVPSINSVLQISSDELLPALNEVFLLDTFSISTVPVAIRSFVHHFYPAYLDVFEEYVLKSDPDRKMEDETTKPSKK